MYKRQKFLLCSRDYDKARHIINCEYAKLKVVNPRVVKPERIMTLIRVIEDLIDRDCIAQSAVSRSHARAIRATRSSSKGEPDKEGLKGDDEEGLMLNDSWGTLTLRKLEKA